MSHESVSEISFTQVRKPVKDKLATDAIDAAYGLPGPVRADFSEEARPVHRSIFRNVGDDLTLSELRGLRWAAAQLKGTAFAEIVAELPGV
jgi:hypothetical protein